MVLLAPASPRDAQRHFLGSESRIPKHFFIDFVIRSDEYSAAVPGRGGNRIGAGRKPRDGVAMTSLLQVRMTEQRYTAFRGVCARDGRRVSDAVNEFVEGCLRRGTTIRGRK